MDHFPWLIAIFNYRRRASCSWGEPTAANSRGVAERIAAKSEVTIVTVLPQWSLGQSGLGKGDAKRLNSASPKNSNNDSGRIMGGYHQVLFHGVSSNFVFGAPASTLRGSGSLFRFGFTAQRKKSPGGPGLGWRLQIRRVRKSRHWRFIGGITAISDHTWMIYIYNYIYIYLY